MLKSKETNFRRVTTRVTASDEHSVVRMKTALIQTDLGKRDKFMLLDEGVEDELMGLTLTYWVKTFPSK